MKPDKIRIMKALFTLVFLFIGLFSFGQSQAEMNKEAYIDYNKSDKKLKEIYQIILTEYKADSTFITNLKTSQRLWIQFRDAEMSMKYPDYPNEHYGSIQPLCRAHYLKELTDKRAETLKQWIIGTEEGDLCGGSVKMIDEISDSDMEKGYIETDSTLSISANMRNDHRIFGYKTPDIYSEKMILLSVFTNEVEDNPLGCKYRAYYDTYGMKNIRLKYHSTKGDFIKAEIIKNEQVLDVVYMLRKWFEFEE